MPTPLIEIWYLPPIARKRRFVPRQSQVEVLLSNSLCSQPEKSGPRPSLAIGSVSWIDPRCILPTAEPLKLSETLPTPDLTESVPSLSPLSAKPTAGTARAKASMLIKTRRLIDARSIDPAGVPSLRGL